MPGTVAAGQSLARDDIAPLGLTGRHKAGEARNPVQVDRARAAFALLARVLRARQAHPLAEHEQQAFARPDIVGLMPNAVDSRRHPHEAITPRPPLRPVRQPASSARSADSRTRPTPGSAWPARPGNAAGS